MARAAGGGGGGVGGDGGCGVSVAACAHSGRDLAGVGGKKVQRIYDAFHEPFLSSKKPRTEL